MKAFLILIYLIAKGGSQVYIYSNEKNVPLKIKQTMLSLLIREVVFRVIVSLGLLLRVVAFARLAALHLPTE
jgi:hypothetical protein